MPETPPTKLSTGIADATPSVVSGVHPRRVPSQRRSRERMDRILVVAKEIIAEQGSDALRMSEVAERAAISIGSLYQYFPDKASVIHTLAEHYDAESRRCVEASCAAVRHPRDLPLALASIVSGYYALFLAEPVMRDIWSGLQADRTLRAMAAHEGQVLTQMVVAAVLRAFPHADPAEVELTTGLMMELTEATMRLAIAVPREVGDAMVDRFQAIFIRELTALGES